MILQAPFPYFGGKSRIASEAWVRLGAVKNYVEPFAGSLAVLLKRPDVGKIETVNDASGFVSNFWRALRADPDAVAHWATWPVDETMLHARNSWLLNWKSDAEPKLCGDPDYYDAKAAGCWVWGTALWIGSCYCSGNGPWRSIDGKLVKAGGGNTKQRPHLGGAGRGVTKKLPHLGGAGRVNPFPPSDGLLEWFYALADRLRTVRVCCGDWSRVTGPSVTFNHGLTGVFLDPPYSHAERDAHLYSTEDDCSGAVREWAIANGDNPKMRIVLCGYEGEHAMPDNWEVVEWSAAGGYGGQGNGRGNVNKHRERMWCSPHCLNPTGGLFK